jgi:hypothetical protein
VSEWNVGIGEQDNMHPAQQASNPAIMSGSLCQARRRSEDTNGNAYANQEETAVNDKRVGDSHFPSLI